MIPDMPMNIPPGSYTGSAGVSAFTTALHEQISWATQPSGAASLLVLVGSGSTYEGLTGIGDQRWAIPKAEVPGDTRRARQGAHLDHIQEVICDAFGLTAAQLAELCGVKSRRTLYNWRKGTSAPRTAAQKRLYALYHAAKDWRRSGYPQPGNGLHEPLLAGRSLHGLLAADIVSFEAVQALGARLLLDERPQVLDDGI